MKLINFEKYQAAGNDFIIVDNRENSLDNLSELAKAICDRHYGIGADGLLVLERSKNCDAKMIYYNSDGSTASMCGNGIRCLAKYIYDHEILKQNGMNIETLAGLIKVDLITENNTITELKVDLGVIEQSVNDSLTDILIEGNHFQGRLLSVGVGHLVIFEENISTNTAIHYGPLLENYFDQRVNVDFVEVVNRNTIKVITWERGAGLTLACGTGAAASAFVSLVLQKVNPPVKVVMPGGEVKIIFEGNHLILTGKAEKIGEGRYYWERD